MRIMHKYSNSTAKGNTTLSVLYSKSVLACKDTVSLVITHCMVVGEVSNESHGDDPAFLLKSRLFNSAVASNTYQFYNTSSSAGDVKFNGVPYGFIFSGSGGFSNQKAVLVDTAYSRQHAVQLLQYLRDGKYLDANTYRVGYRILFFSPTGEVFGLFRMKCYLKRAPSCFCISKALPDISFRKNLPAKLLHSLVWQLWIVIFFAMMAHHTRIVNPGEQSELYNNWSCANPNYHQLTPLHVWICSTQASRLVLVKSVRSTDAVGS